MSPYSEFHAVTAELYTEIKNVNDALNYYLRFIASHRIHILLRGYCVLLLLGCALAGTAYYLVRSEARFGRYTPQKLQ